MVEANCPFCHPNAAQIFFVGDSVLGLWDAYPVSPGHAVLISKRHVRDWFDASSQERAELTDAVGIARDRILRAHSPDGFNIGTNVGTAAGQTVPHLHLHVIPRYSGDVIDPRGGIRGVIPVRARYDVRDEHLAAVHEEGSQWFSSDAPPQLVADAESRSSMSGAGFGERLLQLLDEGQFTATYKFAVLLALTELCLEHDAAPGERLALTTRALAEKVIELYWPQTTPYVGPTTTKTLVQNRGGQAEIVSAICHFRERSGEDPGGSLWRVRTRAPERFDRLVRRVEWKLIEMPLPRLQVVGTNESRFLYEIAWNVRVRRQEVEAKEFDGRIRLLSGVAENLIRLSGLLRPLIQRAWAAMVAGINRDATDEARLHEFLFGASRISLDPLRKPLRELQDNRCFYCDKRMTGPVDIDHFIPWSRHADNGIRNLVAADQQCNNHKRDFLAAGQHAKRWAERIRTDDSHSSRLAEIARRAGWEDIPDRTFRVASSIYGRLPDDVQLWRGGRDFSTVGAERPMLAEAFGLGCLKNDPPDL